MIVVPTYNGYWPLSKLVKSLEEFGTNKHSVLVVDNGTTDLVSKKYLQSLSGYMGPIDIKVEKNKYSRYETGAWIHAIREYPNEDTFILLHDSCVATSKHWLTQFEEKLTPERGAVSWIKFQPCLFAVYPPHYEYMKNICSWDDVPDGGIFGSIFMAYGSVLREFDSEGYFNVPPTLKVHAEAWERIWAILFHINGYNIDNIITGFNPNAIHFGQYPHLCKKFSGRQ